MCLTRFPSFTILFFILATAAASCVPLKPPTSFKSAQALSFAVEGPIPGWNGVTYPNSWAGRLPNAAHEGADEYYFWLWEAEGNVGVDDFIIWIHGGPGCSGLSAMMTENGPVTLIDSNGTLRENPYSWNKIANILYLDQPVGTGFSLGTPTAAGTAELAPLFAGFLENFFEAFPELASKRLWLAGESYAGRFIPYFADWLNTKTTRKVSGVYLGDALVSTWVQQQYMSTLEFARATNEFLHLTQDNMTEILAASDACGWTDFTVKNLHYPSRGLIADYNHTYCPTYDTFIYGALQADPLFNVYRVDVVQPLSQAAPLGIPGQPISNSTFFNSYAMQKKIHALQPDGTTTPWQVCVPSFESAFPNGDASDPPLTVNLGRVFDASTRAVVAHARYDGLFQLNSTLVAMQNVTWGKPADRVQGFRRPPTTHILRDTDGNAAGTFVTERGVTLAIVHESGHEIPADAPSAALKMIKFTLGQVPTLA